MTPVYVALVFFIATLVRSTFGFGEALLAVPLLSLFLPVPVATPLAVMVSITIAAVCVLQDWSKIRFRSTLGLLLATLPGIPLGVTLLAAGHPRLVKTLLALLIIGFASWSLRRRPRPEAHEEAMPWLLACGFLAGVLGGAFGFNGPPLVVYGTRRGWSAPEFRATLQGYFLPASMLGLCGFWSQGLCTPTVWHDFLLTLPVVLPAIWIGRHLNLRLTGSQFLRYVYALLIATGTALLWQAFTR
ncbi:MAG: sulfite exporter TauE/SafE family protein [Candidatus Xenobia bacterium]